MAQPSEATSSCRSCGAEITWGETPGGKRAPSNPDGTSHFRTCPDAKQWSRPATNGATSAPAQQDRYYASSLRVAALQAAATFAAGKALGGDAEISSSAATRVAEAFEHWLLRKEADART